MPMHFSFTSGSEPLFNTYDITNKISCFSCGVIIIEILLKRNKTEIFGRHISHVGFYAFESKIFDGMESLEWTLAVRKLSCGAEM